MKQHILIIEDDQFLGDVLTQKLRHEGYMVDLARDGGEGLAQMKSLKPDLVLLDIILPTMSGYEILEARQSDPTISAIPVIIISNSGQPVEISRALSLGIKDYLVKAQMDPEDVFERVQKVFAGSTASVAGGRLADSTVLWVEDDSFLSDLVSAKLSHEGCKGLYAKDGEHALEILKTEVPDIILLDLVLPGMSGFEVLEKIKANPALKDVPVIILSNLGQEKDVEKTKALGAIKHLVKAEHDLDDIIGEIVTTLKK